MEGDEEMFETICRLCLSSEDSEKLVSLVESNSASGISCYGESVKRFAQVSIEKDDKLPKNMCRKCLYLLKCAIYFKFKCESSDKILREWTNVKVNRKRKKGSSAKETAQNSLFKKYFSNVNQPSTSTLTESSKITQSSAQILPNADENDTLDDSTVDDGFLTENRQNSSVNKPQDDSSDILDILENNPTAPSTSTSKDNENYLLQFRRKRKSQKSVQKFECEVCKKLLANQITYENHMQSHYGCKFICEHCGKGFATRGSLQGHSLTQHGIGPHRKCQYCSYKAPGRVSLIEHVRIHTGERPFTCEKCGMTFRRRALWKKHLIYHSEKTVQCPQCPKKFFTIPDLKAHSNNMHERVYMYCCSKCSATYTKTETVRKHLLDNHGIPKEMQGKIKRITRGKTGNIVEP